jgi:hypothetical protein
MFTVFIYPPTQEFYPHRWRNNFIKMLSWICKKNFNQPSPNTMYNLPLCLNIYKLFRKWQRYPNLNKYIIANSWTQMYVCLYHMILLMSFLYFQWNTRAHARWTRRFISHLTILAAVISLSCCSTRKQIYLSHGNIGSCNLPVLLQH